MRNSTKPNGRDTTAITSGCNPREEFRLRCRYNHRGEKSVTAGYRCASAILLLVLGLCAAPQYLLAQVPSAASDPEAAGQAAQQAGRFQDAFLAYLSAYQALPDPAPAAEDRRLRERIIRIVQRLGTLPAIPSDAREHARKADELLAAEAMLGNTADASSQAAAIELSRAVRSAPWWPEATFKLATVLQRLQRLDEALMNLNLYKLADPVGYLENLDRTAPRIAAAPPVAPVVVRRPVGPAIVYIYWPEQARGGARQKVMCNEQKVADLQNNRFVMLKVAAGTHTFTFRDRHITAVVEGDREYHYRTSIEGNTRFSLGPEIRLMNADAAKAEMRKQGMTPNDARRTFSSDCLAAPAVRGRPR